MKCNICGHEIADGDVFCPQCGNRVTSAPPPAGQNPKNSLNIPLLSGIGIGLLALIGAVIFFIIGSAARPISDEKAQPIINEAVSYITNHEYDAAKTLLSETKLREDSQYLQQYAELSEIANARPVVSYTDIATYPEVTMEIETSERDITYSEEDFEISFDNYSYIEPTDFEKDGNIYRITYLFPENNGGINVDGKVYFTRYQTIDFYITFDFVTRQVTDVNLSLITSNVEAYPEISLYFKALDSYGNPIENLSKDFFTIKEYLNVNDYLERDVIYAAKVDGKDALNVSLAIDRSGSISPADMNKIKNATNTFLSKLQFNSGDKAEVISFEKNVMQMCLFTNKKEFLMNGVNSMHPYGTTACYDAIATSIKNASVQNGARCVIVFTDGEDNESVNDVNSVINLAIAKSVPVYTIGVGSTLREHDLKRIASSTGGTYHHIDDYSAMSRVYDEIYREQKNLYHIKYISDTSFSATKERRIIARILGGGFRGECDKTYTPIIPVSASSHGSRYQIVKADISWEAANRACIEKGGHLATISSRSEELEIIKQVENVSNLERLWIGGYTTNDRYGDATGHWVTGETFGYQNWYENEPSRFDSDDAEEFYLMLWKINNVWSWNDQRNDLINSPFANTYKGRMGYIIEYEN